MSHFAKVLKLLKSTSVEKIAPKANEIISVKLSTTVRDGLRILMEKKILSVPVFDDDNKARGYIDVLDIVSFCVEIFTEVKEAKSEESIYKRLASGTKFGNSKIGDIKDFSKMSKPYEVVVGSKVFDVMKYFVENNAHRVFIKDKEGKLVSLLTQSAVLRFVCENPKTFVGKENFGEMHVKDFPKLGTHPVFCVHKNTKTIKSFTIMKEKGFSGLGIADNDGRLIGNISARDLEWVNERHFFGNLLMSVGKFIQAIRLSVIDEGTPVISCREETSLSYIVRRLVGNRVHRIYVVDPNLKPLRIISLRDLFCLFVKSNQ